MPDERACDARAHEHAAVGRDDVDRLVALLGGKLPDRQPHELKHRARILPATVTDHPGDGVTEIELADLVAVSLDRLDKAELPKGGTRSP